MDTSQSTLGRCSTGARQHLDQGSIIALFQYHRRLGMVHLLIYNVKNPIRAQRSKLGGWVSIPAHFVILVLMMTSRYTSGGDDDISWSEKYHAPPNDYYHGNGHSSWEAVSSSHKPLIDTVSTRSSTHHVPYKVLEVPCTIKRLLQRQWSRHSSH